MLYIVSTPIGNLKDLSFRAVEVLNSVDEIACEDTRHSQVLLSNYGIKKPLFSYHKFNERESGERLINSLKEGKNIALITDAGTPIISDPGNVLVNMLIENQLEYTVIPGACALISALVLSGLNASKFCFLGFLPEKTGERKQFLSRYKNLDMTLIFYCAPHDIVDTVKDIYEELGDRVAVAVKEISKIYESVERFNLADGYKNTPKGEYVLLLDKCENSNPLLKLSEEEHINHYIDMGMDKKEAVKLAAKERNVPKSSLYKYTVGK